MKATDAIRIRKSVRTYSGTPLSEEQKTELQSYISSLPQPLGGKARIELLARHSGEKAVKLGTYGVITGATDFMALVYQPGPLAEANAGYLMEQVVLHCTAQSLGTCWLGGTFKKTDFAKTLGRMDPDEMVRIVSPVGQAADKPKRLEKLMRAGAGSDKRKTFEELFFDGIQGGALARGGAYDTPLEMMRLAPSASNSQPWRVIVTEKTAHFYYLNKSRFTDIDMGIALCHFELTCREMGIGGELRVLPDSPASDALNYLISWVP